MKFLSFLASLLFSFNAVAISLCSSEGPILNQAKIYLEHLDIEFYLDDGSLTLLTNNELDELETTLIWKGSKFVGDFYSKRTKKVYELTLNCDGTWDLDEYFED